MLSLKHHDKARPLSIIKGGRYNGQIIYLYDENLISECTKKKSCCNSCEGGGKTNKKTKKKPKKKPKKKSKKKIKTDDESENFEQYQDTETEESEEEDSASQSDEGEEDDVDEEELAAILQDKMQDPYDYISEDTIKRRGRKVTTVDLDTLKNAYRTKTMPDNEELALIYNTTKDDFQRNVQKEFIIHDGEMMPLPNIGKTERIYVAGPTDSGKTTWVSKYMKEFKRLFPKKKRYVFSDVKEDKPLDKLGILRIDLDEDLITDPLRPEELKSSLVIFDDIDSIQNKKLSKTVEALRDSLLKRGRHEEIYMVVTAHQLTNYKESRTILNECGAIVFFPRSGSSHAIEYCLRNYCGLNKQQIKRVFQLPSRWVMLYKNYPMFVIYQTGIYLL